MIDDSSSLPDEQQLLAESLEVGVLSLLEEQAGGRLLCSPAIAAVLAEAQKGALNRRSSPY